MRLAMFAACLIPAMTGCYYVGPRNLSNTVIASDPEAAAGPIEPEKKKLTSFIAHIEDAREAGPKEERVIVPFDAAEDGTQLLVDFLADARNRGAIAVSDINLVFERQKGVECRLGIQPEEGEADPIAVPQGARMVQAPKPTRKNVTENEILCSETEYRCNYASDRIPYQKSYACTVQPAPRPPTSRQAVAPCRVQKVTHQANRYDFEYTAQFNPPHLEEIQRAPLVETAPACYAPPSDAKAPPSPYRLEATLHFTE